MYSTPLEDKKSFFRHLDSLLVMLSITKQTDQKWGIGPVVVSSSDLHQAAVITPSDNVLIGA
jgi:hypothetical protein